MDKGAHFYKCDFQVHSPRDINWTGHRFGVLADRLASLSDEDKETLISERKQFAKEYLDKVRSAGLNAIAITDHHDVVFAKIIRQTAKEENELFAILGEEEKSIAVFPGIELTLDSPLCQCLILFDSDFTDSHLDSVLGTLGITPSNEFEKQTAPVVRISMPHINDLSHLHKKLDEIPYCIGRYIILPNVNKGGTSTLLREGAHAHYKKMPCVGGYVDKELSTDTGWLNKLNGGDVNYGNKAIGVISTSDNRFEDGREFGKYFTWIKWSEPSAEALRQACLAKTSRISQQNPTLPQIHITKIDVTNSKFLGSFSIEFNQQYNCLIGGRGTGKSTVLEYLRWALCDQTVNTDETDELNEIEKRRKGLIDKTLSQFDGEVRVTFVLNGVNHFVKRNAVSNEIMLKIDTGEFQKVSEDDVRRIFPIQAYSQKQLSSVGVTTEELKRFIQSPIRHELENLNFQLDDNVKRTRNAYSNLLRKGAIEKEIDQFSIEITSLSNQVQKLRQSLTGISAEDQAVIARKPVIDNESNFVEAAKRELNTISIKIKELDSALQKFPEVLPAGNIENIELINNINVARNNKIVEIKGLVDQLKATLALENILEIRSAIGEWAAVKTNYDVLYDHAKAKTTSNQQQLGEIERIEERLIQLKNSISDRHDILRELGEPSNEFNQLRESYWSIHDQKAQMLHEQALQFEDLSKSQIKVEVLKNLDLGAIKEGIVRVFQGARIQSDRIQLICDSIGSNENPLRQWASILEEFRLLAEINLLSDSNQLIPATQKLTSFGFNSNIIKRVAEVLSPDAWLNLATMKIEFTPNFRYTTNSEMEDVIPFSDASAGQQATALLTVLLNQPGAPLIIDQPEDDIDNRAIDEIIKNIWDAKCHRQLIFTSHNANLVVNGDAELVICCDYRESGNQTRGIVKAEGAIDSRAVKNEITSVMEGGEKAFKLRKDKYGF